MRDVSTSKHHQQELSERLNITDPVVPQLFAGGHWLGVSFDYNQLIKKKLIFT